MKLFLMRHAQAEEANGKSDIDRNLTIVGENEASTAAEKLSHYQIDRILVSPANRTMQTAKIVQDKVKCNSYKILPELYASNSGKIIKIISMQNSTNKNILVIAHNPAIFKSALQLVDENSNEYDILLENGMPTANIIILDFPHIDSWRELSINKGTLLYT